MTCTIVVVTIREREIENEGDEIIEYSYYTKLKGRGGWETKKNDFVLTETSLKTREVTVGEKTYCRNKLDDEISKRRDRCELNF
jgi:hypothetical protein